MQTGSLKKFHGFPSQSAVGITFNPNKPAGLVVNGYATTCAVGGKGNVDGMRSMFEKVFVSARSNVTRTRPKTGEDRTTFETVARTPLPKVDALAD